MSTLSSSVVGHAVWHVAGGNKATRGLAVPGLVIEENIGAKGLQKLALVEPSKKGGLVDPDVPGPQCTDDPFMRGGTASGE